MGEAVRLYANSNRLCKGRRKPLLGTSRVRGREKKKMDHIRDIFRVRNRPFPTRSVHYINIGGAQLCYDLVSWNA